MNNNLKYKTKSFKETQEVAGDLAKNILKNKTCLPGRQAFIIALKGDLGAGKTTFIQGFAKKLGIKEKVTSPTFNIYKSYKLKFTNYKLFYHFDCYRIEKPKDILDLNFENIIFDSKNIVVIEWAEKIKKIMPKNVLWIEFIFIDKNKREIKVKDILQLRDIL